jgi:hypothetical protein
MAARGRWRDGVLIASLLVAGAALCLYRLDRIPPRVSSDEYTTVVEAFEILHGKGPPLFGLDWKPMPALTTHATALLMRIVGPSLAGMRLLSVLLGLTAAVLLYGLLRHHCSAVAAWAAALLLLSNPWFLNFARSGWENGHAGTYWLLFTWCFLAALRDRRRRWLHCAGAGCALALSLYGYFSGRLLLVSWLLFLPAAAGATGRPWRDVAKVYGMILVIGALLFAPQVPAIGRNWDRFQQRVRTVSLFEANPGDHGYQSHTEMALSQLGRATRYLIAGSGLGNVHYSPPDRSPFHAALVPLLLLGLGRALWGWRTGLWWWLLLIVPIVSTQGLSITGDPNLARIAGVSVVFFWFIGYGIALVVDRFGTTYRRLAAVALALVTLGVSWQEWRYFNWWMQLPGVAVARGFGVDHRDYPRWREIQFERIARGERPVHVIEWERPEVREALLGEAGE